MPNLPAYAPSTQSSETSPSLFSFSFASPTNRVFPSDDSATTSTSRGFQQPALANPTPPVKAGNASFRILHEADQPSALVNSIKKFLATEDRNIASHLRNEFGNKLITAQDQIKYSGHGFLSQSHGVSGNLNRAESYIANMILLSKCKFVLAARTSGAVGAALMAQDTSNWKFYDLGVY